MLSIELLFRCEDSIRYISDELFRPWLLTLASCFSYRAVCLFLELLGLRVTFLVLSYWDSSMMSEVVLLK